MMKMFNSDKERKYWVLATVTVIAIYLSAFISQPIAGFLREQGFLEIIFFIGFILILLTILMFQIKSKPRWQEIAVWVGIIAVYLMLLVRIEIPEERTHIIEYSVLALFVSEAFFERMKRSNSKLKPAVYAFLLTSFAGLIDESIQYLIPNRVFDIRDILFNMFAAFMTVAAILLINWIRIRLNKAT